MKTFYFKVIDDGNPPAIVSAEADNPIEAFNLLKPSYISVELKWLPFYNVT